MPFTNKTHLPVIRPLASLCCALLLLTPLAARAFGFDDVAARAAADARAPYRAPNTELPAELAGMTYDQYRDIRFRPDRALWRR